MAGAALKRAAHRPRIIAAQARTPLIIYKNDRMEKRIIEEIPLESRI